MKRAVKRLGPTVAVCVWALTVPSRAGADMLTVGPLPYAIPNGPFSLLVPSDGGFTGTPPRPLIALAEIGLTALAVPRFDPSLGTLTGITFSLAATLQPGTADVIGISPGPSEQITFRSEVRAFGPAGLLVSAGNEATLALPSTGFNMSVPVVGGSATGSTSFNSPDALLPFVGTGTFEVDLLKHLEALPTPASFVHTRLTAAGSAEGDLSVTYQFTPAQAAVPEPSSLVLLGCGLLSLLRYVCRQPRVAEANGSTELADRVASVRLNH
jgi:hypothetical protein